MKITDVATSMRVRLLGMNRALIPTKVVDLPLGGEASNDRIPENDREFKFVVTYLAERLFEFSNSPFTPEDKREQYWGSHRSLSVGDVVEIDFTVGGTYVAICQPAGWYATPLDQDAKDLIAALEAGDMFDRSQILSR
jgi:hypothetical protein